MWKTMSDVSESPDVIVAWSTDFWDMLFEIKSIVDNHTKTAKGNGWFDCVAGYRDDWVGWFSLI